MLSTCQVHACPACAIQSSEVARALRTSVILSALTTKCPISLCLSLLRWSLWQGRS